MPEGTVGPLIRNILSGMAKMPRMPLKHITAWRGRPESMTALRQVYTPGRVVKWSAFTSCSMRIDNAAFMANWAQGCVLKLVLTNAVSIAGMSCYPHEDEILLPPNTTFVVTHKIGRASCRERVSSPV